MKYDLIVLGGGPGGYLAAERAGHAGLNVLLIERNKLGGTCLNEGCIPSKTFLQTAKVADYIKHADKYGVTATGGEVNQKFVVDRKTRITRKLVGGVKIAMREAGVTVVDGVGIIVGKNEEGIEVIANETSYYGKDLIIATGSYSVEPPISGLAQGLADGRVMTNREILDLTTIPQSLVVIGGGVIGLEMASYFNSVGSKVTVIEMLPNIAGQTDSEIATLLMGVYQKKGIEFIMGARVTKVDETGVTYELDGTEQVVPCEKILLSVGRKANTVGIGLESLNIETNRGAIVTDSHLHTNVEHVYAVGDVNGKIMLAHTAYREAEVAVNDILGIADEMSYDAIPSVIYTNPEVACVGLTEANAIARGLKVKTVNISMQYSGRFVAENTDLDGICKLVFDEDKNTLIGAHIMGNGASEFIFAVGMMINMQVDVETIKKQVFPHPTVGEIIREGIFRK